SLNLTDSQQKELQSFLASEQQRAAFQAQVHEFTETCWDKCITKIRPSLDKSEEVCISNCVERFVDTTVVLLQ
ncbi:Tim10/DDP family zinc finger protein, partial [Entophlyctis helioformis]